MTFQKIKAHHMSPQLEGGKANIEKTSYLTWFMLASINMSRALKSCLCRTKFLKDRILFPQLKPLLDM